jgi:hypothetical protein
MKGLHLLRLLPSAARLQFTLKPLLFVCPSISYPFPTDITTQLEKGPWTMKVTALLVYPLPTLHIGPGTSDLTPHRPQSTGWFQQVR